MHRSKRALLSLLLLYRVASLPSICDPLESTPTHCKLVSSSLVLDFAFEFPESIGGVESFEISGQDITIACDLPCSKIVFRNKKDYPVKFSLKNSIIKAPAVVLIFKGGLSMVSSSVNADSLGYEVVDERCVSLSGYCYSSHYESKPTGISKSLFSFSAFLASGEPEELMQFTGLSVSRKAEERGGGVVIVHVEKLELDSSIISSKYVVPAEMYSKKESRENGNHRGDTGEKGDLGDEEAPVGSGTGGYVFINADSIEISRIFGSAISVTGACWKKLGTTYASSSSSGQVVMKASEIKLDGDQIVTEGVMNLVSVDLDCVKSSSGALFLSLNRNFQLLFYTKKSANSKTTHPEELSESSGSGHWTEGDRWAVRGSEEENFTSYFAFTWSGPFIAERLVANGVTLNIRFRCESSYSITSIETLDSKLKLSVTQPESLMELKSLISLDSQLTLYNVQYMVTGTFRLAKSLLLYRRVFVGGEDFAFQGSKIEPFALQAEADIYEFPGFDLSKLKGADFVRGLASRSSLTFFVASSKRSLEIGENSTLRGGLLALFAPVIRIQKEATLRATFRVAGQRVLSAEFCGLPGASNSGAGFLSPSASSALCLSIFLRSARRFFARGASTAPTVGTPPRIFARVPYVELASETGGLIWLEAEGKLSVAGRLLAAGTNAVSDGVRLVSATAGGSVAALATDYEFSDSAVISVEGGKFAGRAGGGGGGKVVLSLRSETSGLRKSNFELGESVFFESEPQSPNPAATFGRSQRPRLAGRVMNIGECLPGFWGPFCEVCGPGRFKPDYGEEPCYACPCATGGGSSTPAVRVSDCRCEKLSIFQVYYLEMFLIVGIVLAVLVYNFRRRKNEANGAVELKLEMLPNAGARLCATGANSPLDPLRLTRAGLPPSVPREFVREFNAACKFSMMEKALLLVSYIVSFSPGYLLVLYSLRAARIDRIRKLLRGFAMNSETRGRSTSIKRGGAGEGGRNSFDGIKQIRRGGGVEGEGALTDLMSNRRGGTSASMDPSSTRRAFQTELCPDLRIFLITAPSLSHVELVLVDRRADRLSHNFQFQFPFESQILGDGSFQNEFKINLGDPYLVALFQILKRAVPARTGPSTVPSVLLSSFTPKSSSNPQIDALFAFLNLNLSTVLVNLPYHKLISRLSALKALLSEINEYLSHSGFEVKIFLDFSLNGKRSRLSFVDLCQIPRDSVTSFRYLFGFAHVSGAKLAFHVSKIAKKPHEFSDAAPRKDSSSLYLLDAYIEQKIRPKNSKSQLKIFENPDDFLPQDPVRRFFYKLKSQFFSFVQINVWKLFTYHDCSLYTPKAQTITLCLYLCQTILLKLLFSNSSSFYSYIVTSLVIFPLSEEFTIIMVILQSILNKKKLSKLIIYTNFFSFLKSVLVGFYMLFREESSSKQLLYLYWFNAFLCFTVSYVSCFNLSYESFTKFYKKLAKIN